MPAWALIPLVLLSAAGSAVAASRDVSVLISVKDAVAMKKNKPCSLFVDLRRAAAFSRVRIEGSINIPPHFVRTKQYLRSMAVILVNEGYGLEALVRLAKDLNERGFTASVLNGGLAAWHQQGQRLAGDPFAGQGLHLLPAVALLPSDSLSHFDRILDISAGAGEKTTASFPRSEPLQVEKREDFERLVKAVNALDHDPSATVLILNREGNYDLVASLPKHSSVTIFFLKGGLAAYRKAVRQQAAILRPRKQRIKKTGGCATCPPAIKDTEPE